MSIRYTVPPINRPCRKRDSLKKATSIPIVSKSKLHKKPVQSEDDTNNITAIPLRSVTSVPLQKNNKSLSRPKAFIPDKPAEDAPIQRRQSAPCHRPINEKRVFLDRVNTFHAEYTLMKEYYEETIKTLNRENVKLRKQNRVLSKAQTAQYSCTLESVHCIASFTFKNERNLDITKDMKRTETVCTR